MFLNMNFLPRATDMCRVATLLDACSNGGSKIVSQVRVKFQFQ